LNIAAAPFKISDHRGSSPSSVGGKRAPTDQSHGEVSKCVVM
jgi:predicted RNase H-like HicB family nuclease